jgi:hypothetical protein
VAVLERECGHLVAEAELPSTYSSLVNDSVDPLPL